MGVGADYPPRGGEQAMGVGTDYPYGDRSGHRGGGERPQPLRPGQGRRQRHKRDGPHGNLPRHFKHCDSKMGDYTGTKGTRKPDPAPTPGRKSSSLATPLAEERGIPERNKEAGGAPLNNRLTLP